MPKCPKCGNDLQLVENGTYYCHVCNKTYKPKSQPQYQPVCETPPVVASTSNVESAKDREIELLKARLDALERGNSAPKQSKTKVAIQSSKAVLFIKKYGVIIFPVLLLLIAFITLMTCLVGIRGIYVNVNDPNEFYSFTATSYEYHGKSMFGGGDYVDKGTWKKSGNTLSLTYDDEDFGKITENCVIIKNENNKLLVIEDDMGREKTFKRVSIIDYSANIKKVKVTFDPCNGDSPTVKEMKIGSLMPELPEATKTAHDFLGWNTQQDGQGNPAPESKRVWEDVTYYANWSMKLIVENGVLKGTDGRSSVFWHLYIPNNVTSIGTKAFMNDGWLAGITIPNSVTSIGAHAFACCYSLRSIIIPDSVTDIGEYAFMGCNGLTNVVIPNSVTRINSVTFWSCDDLTSITIPDSVTSIGSGVFDDCIKLNTINYNGTKKQWLAIAKKSSWNSGTPDFVIHCTDGDLDKNGNEI